MPGICTAYFGGGFGNHFAWHALVEISSGMDLRTVTFLLLQYSIIHTIQFASHAPFPFIPSPIQAPVTSQTPSLALPRPVHAPHSNTLPPHSVLRLPGGQVKHDYKKEYPYHPKWCIDILERTEVLGKPVHFFHPRVSILPPMFFFMWFIMARNVL